MCVGQLVVIQVDHTAQGVLDRFQHVVDIERRADVVEGDMDLQLMIEWRFASRPRSLSGGPYLRLPSLDAGALSLY